MEPMEVSGQGERLQLIDVREPQEWQAGRIPGSRWIPMGELPDRLNEIDQQQPVVTVCRSGSRSGEMAEFLGGHGYRADNLDGGIQAWAEQGLPVRTPDGEQPGRVV
ncbi:Rhodanese-related sulfurtransferase [Actinopolyspora mzabensis]|uniref:Rhodanese-related sulfurtransferase n=1 Tax=Actinopolyspora mzabensis TaxID=995066 RepID=A0A1G9A018_ACTMZ|nr:rhodanese-like domain-containing protein [Actinopolyspora mzabensis]SDK20547.1 Rhodanese-related sulfurtransferase [Actinopolyspora mzabensis]